MPSFSSLSDRLATRIVVSPWGLLPAPVWFLVASPLLRWSFGSGTPWFRWPIGASRSPLRRSFWRVEAAPHFRGGR